MLEAMLISKEASSYISIEYGQKRWLLLFCEQDLREKVDL